MVVILAAWFLSLISCRHMQYETQRGRGKRKSVYICVVEVEERLNGLFLLVLLRPSSSSAARCPALLL